VVALRGTDQTSAVFSRRWLFGFPELQASFETMPFETFHPLHLGKGMFGYPDIESSHVDYGPFQNSGLGYVAYTFSSHSHLRRCCCNGKASFGSKLLKGSRLHTRRLRFSSPSWTRESSHVADGSFQINVARLYGTQVS